MKFLLIVILFITLNKDVVYHKTQLKDFYLELSSDYNNKCLNNIYLKNLSSDTIQYQIKICRGSFWYFKHNIVMVPNQTKYYNDAFIICDKKECLSVELIKLK
jgi:hypothetical protein